MKLSINIKPVIFIASTKEAVINKAIGNKSYSSGGSTNFYYNGYTEDGWNKKTITVLNLIKVRKKVIHKKDKKNKIKSVEVINSNHWIAYAYTFDMSMLKAMGVRKITQNLRNFTIVK